MTTATFAGLDHECNDPACHVPAFVKTLQHKREVDLHAEVYADLTGRWRWRVKANNGETIADSGQGYVNKADCLHGLALLAGEEPRRWAVMER